MPFSPPESPHLPSFPQVIECIVHCDCVDIDASEDFTEANVRNKIVSIKNIRVLGEKLKIPPSQLECINKLPLESQKQKLVELWFKVDIDCNWKTLETAIRSMKVLEWRTSKSMSDSFTETLTSPSQSCTSSFSEAMITGTHSLWCCDSFDNVFLL